MTNHLMTRAQAMLHSPKLPKVLFVLAVDAGTSCCLIAWEYAHRIRQKVRT